MEHRCYACDLTYSSHNSWYLNRGTDFALCQKCRDDIIRRPKKFKTREERINWLKEHNKGQIPPNKGKRITPKRECFGCGSNTTYLTKDNKYQWRFNRDDNGNILHVMCINCWSRYIQNPITHSKHNKNRIHYKGKDIQLDYNPRTGFCSKCGKKVGDKYINARGKEMTLKATHLHHEIYDDSDVLAHTVELCNSCHSKRSIELGQFADPFLGKK